MRRLQQNLPQLPEDDRLHEKTGLAGLREHKETFWVAMVAIGTWAAAVADLEAQYHPIQNAVEVAANAGQAIADRVLSDIDMLQPIPVPRKLL